MRFHAVKSSRHANPSTWWRHQMEHFPRYWPFVRGIHRFPMNSQHKGQWPGAFVFSLIGAWINRWVNNREAGDLRRYRAHYDVIEMKRWFLGDVQCKATVHQYRDSHVEYIIRQSHERLILALEYPISEKTVFISQLVPLSLPACLGMPSLLLTEIIDPRNGIVTDL